MNDFSNRWCKRENVGPEALKEWKINIFKIIDTRISFYSRNTHLLPPGPGSSFRCLVVVWRLCCINALRRGLVGTNACKLRPSLSEGVIVGGHGCHTALHFGVRARENQDRVPTLYWLPRLHKKPYRAGFVADSGSCAAAELSGLLTSCLAAVEKHVVECCEGVCGRSGGGLFCRLGVQVRFWVGLGLEISVRPVCLLVVFLLFALLCLIVWLGVGLLILLKGPSRERALLALHVVAEVHFLLRKGLGSVVHGRVGVCVVRWPFCWTTFLFDLAPSSIDKYM